MKLKIAVLALLASASLSGTAAEHLKSLNPKYFDPSTPAGTDFYTHVNKGWMEANPLTPERSRYAMFDVLNDSSEIRIKDIVLNLASTNPQPGTVAFKVATVYELAMDSVRRNAEGANPIKPILKKIEDTPAEGMQDLFLWLHKNYSSPFLAPSFMEDLANSNVYAMYLGDSGLGLGDRDYYLKDDPRSKEVREAYKKMIQQQMRNAGYSKKDARRIMESVMNYETALAQDTWTKEAQRNIPAIYNPHTAAEVKAMYPQFPFDEFFTEVMGFETPETIIVTTKSSIDKAYELMNSMTDRQKKDIYLWDIVSGAAGRLSDTFSDTAFEFSKVLSGAKEQRPRWKRALGATEGALGEAVGELYVEKYFPPENKEYMLNLVENLRTALGKHIINLEWMSPDTKLNALKKLMAFTVKIGYPDKFKDYTTMEIDPALSYYENMHNVAMWNQAEYLKKWGKPVDKTEWGMTPQTVNAYYNPVANEIVFPAGILQAPFFDINASDAENYGGIGVVIGHEMTHGFDDQGRNFDDKGNMVDWWTAEDTEAFNAKTGRLVEQFNEVEVLPGLHANGAYTLGENIADQGGLNVSHTAFLDSQKIKGVDINSEEAKIDGFTPEQVFYMNYANIWANNIREEAIRQLTTSDVHSLGRNRVNVSLRNLQPFFDAFDITEGQPMFRPEVERVIIW